jgi:GNAT superfamily N-acetyltransferase
MMSQKSQPVSPGRWWERIRRVWTEEGPRVLWYKLLAEFVVRRQVIWQFPLATPPPAPEPKVAVEFRPLTGLDRDAYLRLRPGSDWHHVVSRLESGHVAWVADRQGELIAEAWAAVGAPVWVEYLDCDFPLEPGEAYLYQLMTVPAYRHRGVNVALLARLLGELGRRGCSRGFAYLRPGAPAGRHYRRWGAREVGAAGYYWMGPWRWRFFRREPLAEAPAPQPAGASRSARETRS